MMFNPTLKADPPVDDILHAARVAQASIEAEENMAQALAELTMPPKTLDFLAKRYGVKRQ
jgi:hypothetical protein